MLKRETRPFMRKPAWLWFCSIAFSWGIAYIIGGLVGGIVGAFLAWTMLKYFHFAGRSPDNVEKGFGMLLGLSIFIGVGRWLGESFAYGSLRDLLWVSSHAVSGLIGGLAAGYVSRMEASTEAGNGNEDESLRVKETLSLGLAFGAGGVVGMFFSLLLIQVLLQVLGFNVQARTIALSGFLIGGGLAGLSIRQTHRLIVRVGSI